jgi:endonuclease G
MKKTLLFLVCTGFIQIAIAQNNSPMLPSKMTREQVIKHKGYTISYNSSYVLSSWAAYTVTQERTQVPDKIKAKYVPDPQISTRSANKKDYKNGAFEMAQLVSYIDVLHIQGATEETYYMSNIVPMKLAFYTHIWLKTEELVRIWAQEKGDLSIITGPVTKESPFKTIGDNKVAIPKTFYKVVYDPVNQQAIAFRFKNGMSSGKLKSFTLSVEKLEELTGIDYFPEMDEELKEKIKSTVDYDFWDFEPIDGK